MTHVNSSASCCADSTPSPVREVRRFEEDCLFAKQLQARLVQEMQDEMVAAEAEQEEELVDQFDKATQERNEMLTAEAIKKMADEGIA